MSKETPRTISLWAAETFGEAGSDARVAARANEEMAELFVAIATVEPIKKIIEEAADTVIVLCRVSHRAGGSLLDDASRVSEPSDVHSPLEDWYLVQANIEMAKLLRHATSSSEPELTRALCARVYVALRALAGAYGRDLWRAVEAKMAINRQREWKKDGTGHGYHVRPEKAAVQ